MLLLAMSINNNEMIRAATADELAAAARRRWCNKQ
jgi:hypothetical protein